MLPTIGAEIGSWNEVPPNGGMSAMNGGHSSMWKEKSDPTPSAWKRREMDV